MGLPELGFWGIALATLFLVVGWFGKVVDHGHRFPRRALRFDGCRGGALARADAELVYGGFSLGVMPAQMLTQTRPGAQGALLFSACLPTSEFAAPWPDGVPVQIHMMDADEWAEDVPPAARDLVAEVENAELFLYPGEGHLFADSSLADFDQDAAALLKERTLAFLQTVG